MGNQYLEIFVKQSANFSQEIVLTNQTTNTVMNIANLSITGKARKSLYSQNISANFICTMTNNANGILVISLPASETANMKPGRHFFEVSYDDLENNLKDVIVSGIVNIDKTIL